MVRHATLSPLLQLVAITMVAGMGSGCCLFGPHGTYLHHGGLVASGCNSCSDGGCDSCSASDCQDCNAVGPEVVFPGSCGTCQPGCATGGLLPLLTTKLACGSGCGSMYWNEWISDPPECSDPCDNCGCWVGRNCGPNYGPAAYNHRHCGLGICRWLRGRWHGFWGYLHHGPYVGSCYDGSCGGCDALGDATVTQSDSCNCASCSSPLQNNTPTGSPITTEIFEANVIPTAKLTPQPAVKESQSPSRTAVGHRIRR